MGANSPMRRSVNRCEIHAGHEHLHLCHQAQAPALIRNFLQHDPDDLCISAITYAELMHGVEKSQSTAQNRAAITLFLSAMAILSFDDRAAEEYGQIRVDLERKGTPIGPLDTLIAAHARSRGLTLVTNNTREFFRVENLPVEDWTK